MWPLKSKDEVSLNLRHLDLTLADSLIDLEDCLCELLVGTSVALRRVSLP